MKNFTSRAGTGVAAFAAAMSVLWALFIPYAYPWPSLAWAVLACATALWVARTSFSPTPSMSDVISDVDAEPARVPATREPRRVGPAD